MSKERKRLISPDCSARTDHLFDPLLHCFIENLLENATGLSLPHILKYIEIEQVRKGSTSSHTAFL